jgi:hypothetical protein
MRTETSARGTGGSERDAPSASASNSTLSSSREKLHLKPQVVRIEVLGDEKVGKTSLICSLVSRHYSEKVPSVLLNVQIPAEESDENVIISITDTSCTLPLAHTHCFDAVYVCANEWISSPLFLFDLYSAGIRPDARGKRHEAQ